LATDEDELLVTITGLLINFGVTVEAILEEALLAVILEPAAELADADGAFGLTKRSFFLLAPKSPILPSCSFSLEIISHRPYHSSFRYTAGWRWSFYTRHKPLTGILLSAGTCTTVGKKAAFLNNASNSR